MIKYCSDFGPYQYPNFDGFEICRIIKELHLSKITVVCVFANELVGGYLAILQFINITETGNMEVLLANETRNLDYPAEFHLTTINTSDDSIYLIVFALTSSGDVIGNSPVKWEFTTPEIRTPTPYPDNTTQFLGGGTIKSSGSFFTTHPLQTLLVIIFSNIIMLN